MSKTIRVEHLARVEGHGGITVEMDGDEVSKVQFDIFEGARLIEGLVRGRSFLDVSQIVSRICAICSVAHSVTSLKATENALGIKPSPQTDLLRDLMFRGENIESHALHVFFLAVPDYLYLPSAIALAEVNAEAATLALRMKKLGNTIQETIGGRAVHPVNAIPGGFGKLPTTDQLIALRKDLLQGMADCKAAVDLLASLPPADFCSTETSFAALRSSTDYGYYLGDELVVSSNGSWQSLPAADYRSLTNEKAVPHSHAKHSSYDGKPFMVGALARLSANGDKLNGRLKEVMSKLDFKLPSGNPMDNNKAQAVELIFDVEQALQSVESLLHDGLKEEPRVSIRSKAGTGTGVTEAPRGLLAHSYTYDEEGRVTAADVITPTAMNAASVENHLRHTVKQSAEKDTPTLTRKLEMIVRAYDPCISCSVHLVRRRRAVF